MGFISKQISKDEAQNLMKKYKISSPWPGRDETAVANMATTLMHDDDTGALFAIVRGGFGVAVDGYRNFDGFDAVGVLIWKDTAVRVNYYENIIDKGKKIFLVATWALAPKIIESYKLEVVKLIKDALLAYHDSRLPVANIAMGTEHIVEEFEMEFSNEGDIWKQRRV
ncbi:MAG: hypothetical protein Q4F02_04385 [Candidatus Saccharibacteria bacterium]|nr:hypothetical protein [Candidatus Saccharibacteria bacterium]